MILVYMAMNYFFSASQIHGSDDGTIALPSLKTSVRTEYVLNQLRFDILSAYLGRSKQYGKLSSLLKSSPASYGFRGRGCEDPAVVVPAMVETLLLPSPPLAAYFETKRMSPTSSGISNACGLHTRNTSVGYSHIQHHFPLKSGDNKLKGGKAPSGEGVGKSRKQEQA